MIGYVISEEPDATIRRIFLYGQANFVRDLNRYLESGLSISATMIDPLSRIKLPEMFEDTAEASAYGLALGLAMRKMTWL